MGQRAAQRHRAHLLTGLRKFGWSPTLDPNHKNQAGIQLLDGRSTRSPLPLDVEFETRIGVDVKGDVWSAIQVPNSAKLFGSLRSVRVDVKVDDVVVENVGLMPTGSGEHLPQRRRGLCLYFRCGTWAAVRTN